jgi:hypothetical protein
MERFANTAGLSQNFEFFPRNGVRLTDSDKTVEVFFKLSKSGRFSFFCIS